MSSPANTFDVIAPTSVVAPARGSLLQRKCACGGTPGPSGECAECRTRRLQRRSRDQAEPSRVPSIVHDVVSSSGQPLDPATRAFMEPRFGHDFGRVPVHSEQVFPHRASIEGGFGISIPGRAVVDTIGCSRRGIYAYTDHLTTHFASERPGLKVAAHEAAHLAQHAGLTRDASLGAEGHAEAAARIVARGGSARGLIGTHGSSIPPAVRPYTEIPTALQSSVEWNAGMPLRVSEDGTMAVGQDSTMHSFWADSGSIARSNSTLTTRKSVIRLHPLADTISGTAPNGGALRTLSKVSPENVATSTSGETMDIWADCGRSGRDVMGAGGGTGWGSMTAAYKTQRRPWWSRIPLLGPLLGAIFGMPGPTERETASTDPEGMKQDIFNEKLGGTGDEGLRKYQALSPPERERFDRETGINRFAAPQVSEGYTMSSGGAPVPGMESNTWNFHWGGVVMLSGDDRVTLENYAVGDPTVQNSDWEFQMYGSAAKPDQTFHEQHKATRQHGEAPTTMHVRKR
jgi:hypothetical protein